MLAINLCWEQALSTNDSNSHYLLTEILIYTEIKNSQTIGISCKFFQRFKYNIEIQWERYHLNKLQQQQQQQINFITLVILIIVSFLGPSRPNINNFICNNNF